jgi:hypothetical protein
MKKLLALVASSLALAACSETTAPDLTPTVEAAKTSLDATAEVSLKKSGRIATN